jgi:hypothetical protein
MNKDNQEGGVPDAERLATFAKASAKHGWHMHYVFDADQDRHPFGVNIHTHGLPDKFGHPDLQICLPLSQERAAALLHGVVNEYLKKGDTITPGEYYNRIAEGLVVTAIATREGDRPVVRLIFPDEEGRFDTALAQMQRGKEPAATLEFIYSFEQAEQVMLAVACEWAMLSHPALLAGYAAGTLAKALPDEAAALLMELRKVSCCLSMTPGDERTPPDWFMACNGKLYYENGRHVSPEAP